MVNLYSLIQNILHNVSGAVKGQVERERTATLYRIHVVGTQLK